MTELLLPRRRRTVLGVAVLAAASVPFLAGSANAVSFCNTTPIVFTPPPTPTAAIIPFAPYPSTVNVSGLSGTITDVNVTFNDLTYTFPEDVDILLVSPTGTNVLVMSDIGGDNDGIAEVVSDIDLTFDDQAANTPPPDSQLTSGTFRTLDDDNDLGDFSTTDTFPAPAPATSANTALSAFNGLAPNGTWSLYVVDDEPGPNVSGDIGGGWCIDVVTGTGPTVTTTPTTSTSTTSSTSTSSTSTSTTSSTSTSSTSTSTTSSTSTSSTSTSLPPTTTSSTSTSTSAPPPTSTSTTTPAGTCDGRTPTIVGTSGDDNIFGTAGPDVIVAGAGNDAVHGLGGDDVICGGTGNDSLHGGEGNDRVFGEAGNDLVTGGNGNDVVSGGAGSDRVFGDSGNDALDGGADPDFCGGGTGTDSSAACESITEVP